VFDEDCLQSQWMVITADSTDVLLGGEEERKAGDECLCALHHFGFDYLETASAFSGDSITIKATNPNT
jgi:hypothetical protein